MYLKAAANLKLPEVFVDVLHIFTAEHGIVIVISINIFDIEKHVRESLAQLIWGTAGCFHGHRRGRLRRYLALKIHNKNP